jgi:hypothetical protein
LRFVRCQRARTERAVAQDSLSLPSQFASAPTRSFWPLTVYGASPHQLILSST